MSDIRKRTGSKGTTYQVRYPNSSSTSGYSYKTFKTLKEARAFREDAKARIQFDSRDATVASVKDATDKWLDICEKEGTDGNEPVTRYTLKTYRRRAEIINEYQWTKPVAELTTPDIVEFRSWLMNNFSMYLAHKTLSSFHTVLKEMALRGIVASNVASGVSVKSSSRYEEDVVIPPVDDIRALLKAADAMAASENKRTAKIWQRYRPILYLAVDSGMRPQEYLAIGIDHIKEDGVLVQRAIERGGYRLSVTKTKSGRRFIDLSQNTLDMLQEYKERFYRKNEHGLLFSTETGRWLQVEHWRKRGFYSACMEAGLVEHHSEDGAEMLKPKYTPYSLRHFYASMLIHQREDLKKIQRLMGHKKIETTFNIYGHLIERVGEQDKSRQGMLERLDS